MMTIETYCPICHTTHELEVPFEAFCAWQAGALVQDAFPMLSANEREMLISGICPPCWDNLFAPSEEEVEEWLEEDEDMDEDGDYEEDMCNLEMGFDPYMGCYSDDC